MYRIYVLALLLSLGAAADATASSYFCARWGANSVDAQGYPDYYYDTCRKLDSDDTRCHEGGEVGVFGAKSKARWVRFVSHRDYCPRP